MIFRRKITSAKVEKICWQITIAAWMQPFQYDLRCSAAKDNSITHAAAAPSNLDAATTMRFAASRSKPAPIYGRGNTKWQQSCSNSNAICHHSFKKRIELCTQEQPLVAKHIGGTIRDRNDPSRNRRTDEVPFIAGCSHFTRKNTRFRAPASSPKHSPCNIHADITLRFAASRSIPAPIYGWQHQMTTNTQPFQCDLAPQLQETHRTTHAGTTIVAKHIGGTIRDRNDPSRNRRTDEVPFIAAATLHGKTQGFVLRLPPQLTTSLPHHFPSSPLPIVTTSHRHHFPSSPPPFVHFPSSPLPIVPTSRPHHSPSSSLPFVTTSLRHHFPSSPLPFVTTSLRHHFPSSPLPFVTTSLRHHFPSSPLPFVTTPLHHHFPSSPLPFIITSLLHPPCVIASYSFVMYCFVIYHPSSRSTAYVSYSFVMYC